MERSLLAAVAHSSRYPGIGRTRSFSWLARGSIKRGRDCGAVIDGSVRGDRYSSEVDAIIAEAAKSSPGEFIIADSAEKLNGTAETASQEGAA